jgi:2-phospho-L-lactate guanylyltransferase
MSLWAIIPARPLEEGKSRLAEALTQAERNELNQTFFRQTLEIAAAVVGREHTLVVSRSEPLLHSARAREFPALLERPPYGLNEALTQAAEAVRLQGADAVLSVSCDLPFLIPDDLRALIAASSSSGLAIGADRSGSGTNALFVSPAGEIPYCYGLDSFALHLRAAAEIGRTMAVVRRPGLSFDVDTQDDFEQMEEIRRERTWVAPVANLGGTSMGCTFRRI